MRRRISNVSAFCLFFSACLSAAEIKGQVVDPSGAPVAGAQVSVVGRVGVEAQTASSASGGFELTPRKLPARSWLSPRPASVPKRCRSNPKFPWPRIAPQIDSVRVVGSAIDVPASEQGGSVNIVSSQEIRDQPAPGDRPAARSAGPGLQPDGPTGGVAGLFIRGGYPTFDLVEIHGVPVNGFGGTFDFAHVPLEMLDRVEVISGPQSAIYGPCANSGVINFVTREPESSPVVDVLAGRQQLGAALRHFGCRTAGRFRNRGVGVAPGDGWSRHQRRLPQ